MKRTASAFAALTLCGVAAVALAARGSVAPVEVSHTDDADSCGAHANALPAAARAVQAQSGPVVRINLPERFRVLTDQLFDLRVEAERLDFGRGTIRIRINGQDVTSTLGAPESSADNDADPATLDRALTFRNVRLAEAGAHTIEAVVFDGPNRYTATTVVGVQRFDLRSQKSIILFIGDAMGTAYRDAGRLVAQSTAERFREGFFDDLQEMDKMPVTGMAMTYALDQIVPDSANTATAWASGNKTIDGALNVFPDNNDFRFNRTNTTTQQATKRFALDNPRVETLWEYLRRRHGYKTGIVTTSEVTDATPAGEGSHTIARQLQNDIARQYVDGTFAAGPVFDVIMGGAKERFISRTVANSGDTRNLATELQSAGFTYVQTRAELNALPEGAAAPSRILGLFRTGNMNVAYDKLRLARPADEPAPNFAGFTDQPFLDEMTAKAIAALSKNGAPFILCVEGASIDKQSHPNLAAGQIWDTIELDKAVGVGRAYLNGSAQARASTLLVTTADHDQSMHIIGSVDTGVPGAIQNVISTLQYPNASRGDTTTGAANRVGEVGDFPDYADANGDRYPENTNRIRLKVGYRTGDHTGSSVPVTAEGAGALLFFGYYDQTDIFFKMARVLSIDTGALDSALNLKTNADVGIYQTPAPAATTIAASSAGRRKESDR